MADIRNVAVIGGGLIGASWAALFVAQGLSVRVHEPDGNTADQVIARVRAAWPDLQALGLTDLEVDTALARLVVTPDMSLACQDIDFVQECGPDRLEVKHAIIARVESCIAPETVIASSSSALLPSEIQARASHPGRILVGHPFNPPHLIPLVELVAGQATRPQAVEAARAFYESLGREVIVPQRELRGHVANRLTAALYREAVHLVAEGVASVADVDRAVSAGPGLRWALMGPHLTYHLGGGAGGFRHYITHLGPAQQARWAELGSPTLDTATIDALIAGVEDELAALDADTLPERRDAALVGLLQLKQRLGFGG